MASGDGARKSPQLTNKIKLKTTIQHNTVTASDSDASIETNSLNSADSTTIEQNHGVGGGGCGGGGSGQSHTTTTIENKQHQPLRRKKTRRGSEWEIMEGLKDGQRFECKPNPYSGFLHKKRKWPLKGWHKVICVNGFFIVLYSQVLLYLLRKYIFEIFWGF